MAKTDLEDMLQEILDNQQTAKEAFDEFKEDVIEKLDDILLTDKGVGFSVSGEM